ncbi:helix-turn-helix transcriptional regulator [Actinopolymorpha cephalotaxi]|uniref:DNA-binding CsgD family transcriptional regulator n=1 Tax=Actinopolymorpha cephalotaxi TaxID=504797 RepID=A0ABX2SDJ0_9ACTN|nr:LuxR family transcriptional regulator [Actinopolymorpha cephalotaxi]NYH86236.1 DNA-binding CsgD family transcriptional regulator [Actinopolymorpha cephalotaxi]
MLYGRAEEQERLAGLVEGARTGRSGVLVLRGEPGIGKTALLDDVADRARAAGLRVLRGAGIEAEATLPYAGLHLLLHPALDRLGALAPPQAGALSAAFGLSSAPAGGDRFLVGLGVLSLLSEVAEDGGAVCLVDDAHWLDRASADALSFAARRLDAEGVALVVAARNAADAFPSTGLAELHLAGLDAGAATALLDSHPVKERLTAQVRVRVLTEAHGNPLALAELPAAFAAAPSGEAARPGALPLTERLRVAFDGQVRRLPPRTQLALLVAAAEDAGHLDVVLRAAGELGAGLTDLADAEDAGLVVAGAGTIRFRHQLVRAAVYEGAPLGLRLKAHRALAAAFADPADRDRRAWHLALASTGPDDHVAAELEATATRAAERGGDAAAATAYERAARSSTTARDRARRLLLAAEAAAQSGDFTRALALADRVPNTPGNPDDPDDPGDPGEERSTERARLALVRANTHFWAGAFPTAHRLLLEGATAAASRDQQLAAWLSMQAMYVAWFTGDRDLSRATADRLRDVRLPAGHPHRAILPLMALLGRLASGAPGPGDSEARDDGDRPSIVAEALGQVGTGDPRTTVMIGGSAWITAQDDLAYDVFASSVDRIRADGRIGWLAGALGSLGEAELFLGRHRDAAARLDEAMRIGADTGQAHAVSHFGGVRAYLAAVRGDEPHLRELVGAVRAATAGDSSPGPSWTQWALATYDLATGRTEASLNRLEALARGPARHQIPATRCAPDQVEAAVRLGAPDRAAESLARLTEWASWVRQPWVDALVRRCRALVAPEEEAEGHFVAALGLHEASAKPWEAAHTRLLYGEWLRRAHRPTDARTQLAAALTAFEQLAAAPWADRARAELRASGSPTVDQAPDPLASLTPQELQIVRLAAEGSSNRDIAARLFLSPRTVGYHLYKAYPKLGVTSRTQLGAIVRAGS